MPLPFMTVYIEKFYTIALQYGLNILRHRLGITGNVKLYRDIFPVPKFRI